MATPDICIYTAVGVMDAMNIDKKQDSILTFFAARKGHMN